jgi:hypothetical protein
MRRPGTLERFKIEVANDIVDEEMEQLGLVIGVVSRICGVKSPVYAADASNACNY